MKTEVKILQSSGRLKFNEEIEHWVNNGEGWELMVPVMACVTPPATTYYIATLVRKVEQ